MKRNSLVVALLAVFSIGCTVFKVQVTEDQAQKGVTAVVQTVGGDVVKEVAKKGLETVKDILEEGKRRLEADTEAQSKILSFIEKKLIEIGLSEEDAKAEVEKLKPSFIKLVKAILSGDKVKIGLAGGAFLLVLIILAWKIFRARRRK